MTKYLYVKSFSWASTIDQQEYRGHLKPKTVYPAVYDSEANLYYVKFDERGGIPVSLVVPSLTLTNSDAIYNFNCELVEITRDNILDFDLPEEQLDNMLPNSGEASRSQIEKGLTKLGEQIQQQRQQEEAEFLAMGYEALQHLYTIDTQRYFTLLQVISYLTNQTVDEFDTPDYDLSVHPEFASGMLLSKIKVDLGNYIDFKEEESLLEVIYNSIREIEQKNINDNEMP